MPEAAAGVLPIRARGLSMRRGERRLIDGLDLAIEGRGITAVIGANGAGKSLLLRLLAGLARADEGGVTWGRTAPDRRRATRIGLVFQHPVMLRRSALDNVAFALKAAGLPRAGRREAALEALEEADLAPLAGWPARLLSGGEQQRVALARALAPRPDALLLDEPTARLDPASTLAIERRVEEARRAGTRIVLVSHDLAQARRLADEVVFMHRGRLEERGPASAFFEAPASPRARAFLEGRLAV